MARLSRKEHLMNIAETLYAKNGIAAVSLREINAAAECSPAALHYHFKNKDELISALLERNFPKLLERKEQLLRELQSSTAELNIDNFVRSMLQPLVEVMYRDEDGERFVKFLARLHLERSESNQHKAMEAYTRDTWAMIFAVLKGFVPNLSERQIKIRWILSMDLTMHSLSNMQSISKRVEDTSLDVQAEVLQTLCSFLAASSKEPKSNHIFFGDSLNEEQEQNTVQIMKEILFSAT